MQMDVAATDGAMLKYMSFSAAEPVVVRARPRLGHETVQRMPHDFLLQPHHLDQLVEIDSRMDAHLLEHVH